MSDPHAYITLISSLPSPEALFLARKPPLSRLRLNQRLRDLEPEDAEALRLVEDALQWSRLPISLTEEEVVARAERALAGIDNEMLRQIVKERLEIRTCVAALRRRNRGEAAPAPGTCWGFGRWTDHIARNWTEATFRLDRVFPWLREADSLMKAGDTVALERLLLQQAWKKLVRLAGEHEFDFEAVVIYVLKWNIVDRWTRYNGEAAMRRFEEMIEASLGDYATLAFEGEA
ncbi:MAG: hypothetical protein Tsb0032_25690 [Kiloniellaceae bacterium]